MRSSEGGGGGVAPLRVVLAPALPSLAALGLADAGVLLEPVPPNAQPLEAARGGSRSRLALPGTPGGGERGARARGRPGGAGTGWVVVQSWRDPSLRELLRARLSPPRSASLAEREWNLLCHLRACGVATPEPLAVGAQGRGPAARRSFLVTRELRGYVPLDAFAARALEPADQARAAAAAASFLARLLRSRFACPRLAARAIGVRAEPEAPAGDPAADACADHPLPAQPNRLPAFVLCDAREGRITRRFAPRAAARMLFTLAADLARAGIEPRRQRSVLRRLLRSGLGADERRALLAALRRASAPAGR